MTPDTLDRAIDAMLAGDLMSAAGDEAATAAALMTMSAEIPPSTGRAGVRRAVLTAAAAPRRPWLRRGFVIAPIAASLALSAVAVVARTALPGDALYQVRRGLQAVHVAAAIGDQSKAVALLDRAERDVADAERALVRSRESDAKHALRAFGRDMATARSEIAKLPAAAAQPLVARADALQRRADALRALIDDDRDDDSGSNAGRDSDDDDSKPDSSGSGSGRDSDDDDSKPDSSGSGSGRDSDDDSKSDSSGSGSGSDDDSKPDSSGSGSGGSGSGSSDD